MSTSPKILVVDDEPAMREALRRILDRQGFQVLEAASGEEALQVLDRQICDVVVLDVAMPGMGGIETLRRIRSGSSLAEVILATGSTQVETAVEAVRAGAMDYVLKPFKKGEIEMAVCNAIERRRSVQQSAVVRHYVEKGSFFPEIIGRSGAIRRVLELVRKVAPTDCAVLIEGETGTGKELIAKEIHRLSRRAATPFVSLNCAGLAETLLESELFGHEKGAFTGADRFKPGILEVADRGTLFLDEVGETSLATQAKLLRVMENGEMRRVGGNATLSVDVRLVAATNRNMGEAVEEGRFRKDLYYRLNTVVLHSPRLRERRDDIPMLAEYFLGRLSAGTPKRISPEAMRILQDYPWPGNVRELRNTVERFVILVEEELIEPRHLPFDAFRRAEAEPATETRLSLAEIEKRHILRVLERQNGNKLKTAKILGLSKPTLYSKLRSYGFLTAKGSLSG